MQDRESISFPNTQSLQSITQVAAERTAYKDRCGTALKASPKLCGEQNPQSCLHWVGAICNPHSSQKKVTE